MGQLRYGMEQDLVLKGLAPTTRRNYLLYCRKFAAHYGRSPEQLGEPEIRAYLLHLIQVEQVSYAHFESWHVCSPRIEVVGMPQQNDDHAIHSTKPPCRLQAAVRNQLVETRR